MTEPRKIPIIELFGFTIQGEGALAGQVSHFIRFGFCGYSCTWCDSMHAVDPAKVKENARYLLSQQIVDEVVALQPNYDKKWLPWVTLTGGDPCLWDLTEVVQGLHIAGFRVAVETQGQFWKEWLCDCDLVTCSPKGPSSGMADKFKIEMLQKYVARLGDKLVVKFVIFDTIDLDWAVRLLKIIPRVRVYLSAGTPVNAIDLKTAILNSYKWLVEETLRRPEWSRATVLPQLHSLVWGRELGR
jgi:7-carboxy-7-deazaguanine synthase